MQGRAERTATPVAGWLLAFLLLLTTLATFWTWQAWHANLQRQFEVAVTRARQATTQKMQAYVATLVGIRSIYASGAPVTRWAFRDLIAGLHLQRGYPGIQGIGVAPWVPAAQVPTFEARAAMTGWPAYVIWPPPVDQAAVPVLFLEPLDWRNRRAIGYDMRSEPVRRAAIDRAASTGEPALTGRVILVQETETDPQPGFLIYVPVYWNGMAVDTPAARRTRLRGFIYSPLRATDLFDSLYVGLEDPWLQLEIFDGPGTTAEGRLHVVNAIPAGQEAAPYATTFTTDIAGHTWTFRATAAASILGPWWRRPPGWVALTGTVLSFLLFGLVRAQTQAREQRTQRLTVDLQLAEDEREEALHREHEARQAAEQAERDERFLATASRLLGSSLDLRQSLPAVAALAVLDHADTCIILCNACSGLPFLSALAHPDPRQARQLRQVWEDGQHRPGQGAICSRVMLTGRTATVHGSTAEVLSRMLSLSDTVPIWRDLGVTAGIGVPVVARGHTIGVLVLLLTGQNRTLSPSYQTLVEDLAQRIGLAIDNALLYREAQTAVAARDEFVAIASHEFRSPLSALKLALFTLKRPPEAGSDVTGILEGAEAQVDRLTALVNELLDISRLSAGRLHLEPEPVDLADVVREAAARLESSLLQSGSPLTLSLEPVVGHWDRFRLDQIVTNLLTNAIRYGRGRPIDVTVSRQNGQATLWVRDRGLGIAPENVERIFAKFERAVSTRQAGGLGLGLYIVRQILDAMGGTIQVTSTPGEGSTFRVTVPTGESCARAA